MHADIDQLAACDLIYPFKPFCTKNGWHLCLETGQLTQVDSAVGES
jgi:hypothetical protein